MPIQRKTPPTIEEVQSRIEGYQTRFNMTSDEFERSGGIIDGVPEDVASDWMFVLEQRRTLQALHPLQYWKVASGPRQPVSTDDSASKGSDKDSERRSLAA